MPVSRFYIYCKSLRLSSGTYLQRLFSTFADGWPGGGLLLQRLLAGGALLYYGAMNLGAAPHSFRTCRAANCRSGLRNPDCCRSVDATGRHDRCRSRGLDRFVSSQGYVDVHCS